MGAISARKSRQIVKNAEHVIAIELLCAAQAMDLFTNLKPGKGTLKAYRIIRKAVRHLETDRVLSHDIGSMVELIRSGKMIAEVEEAVGALH